MINILRKVIGLPLCMILSFVEFFLDMIMRFAGGIFGLAFLLIVIMSILAIITSNWTALCIFAGMAVVGFIALFCIAFIVAEVKMLKDRVLDFTYGDTECYAISE